MAAGNSASQGLSIATGLQKGFDWRGVAASAASGYVSAWAQPAWTSSMGAFGGELATRMAGSIVSAAVRGGSLSRALPGVIADAAGATIGNVLGDSIAAANGQKAAPAPVSADEWQTIMGYFTGGPGAGSNAAMAYLNSTPWSGMSDASAPPLMASAYDATYGPGSLQATDRLRFGTADLDTDIAGAKAFLNGMDKQGMGAASSAAASSKAAWLAGEAQATSNLYAGGAGDIREPVTPISDGGDYSYMDSQGTIQVVGPRMTAAEAAAFDAQQNAALGAWQPAPVFAGDAFSMGWNQQSWTLLEHGSQSQQPASSFVYGVGRGTRSLVDSLTGAASMRQAQQAWQQGDYLRAPLYGMQAFGEAGSSAFGASELLAAKATGIAATTASKIGAPRSPDAGFAHNVADAAKLTENLRTAELANPLVESLKATGQLPSNYVTKSKAGQIGWIPGKALGNSMSDGQLGGDLFRNPSSIGLPMATNRAWYEADIGLNNMMSRKSQPGTRLLYSSDGLAFVTPNHYERIYQIPNWINP